MTWCGCYYRGVEPRICAGGLILRQTADGWQTLLIRHRNGGLIVIKGGVEPGESIEAAALREAREEAGLVEAAIIGSPLGLIERDGSDGDGNAVYKVIRMFLLGGSVRPDLAEEPCEWVFCKNAPGSMQYPEEGAFLEQAYEQLGIG